jgi:hypothetical protein
LAVWAISISSNFLFFLRGLNDTRDASSRGQHLSLGGHKQADALLICYEAVLRAGAKIAPPQFERGYGSIASPDFRDIFLQAICAGNIAVKFNTYIFFQQYIQ